MTTSPTVLIVDDVQATRHGLAELLRLRGFDTREAGDGAEGLRLLRETPSIAAVVLDLRMPHTNGFWFREQQLADPAIAAVPVLIFTGAAEADAARQQLRVSEVLHKPINVDHLLTALARLCAI